MEKNSKIKEINEKKNIDRKNLGKIVLKTILAFSGFSLVKITEVFNPTWNKIKPIIRLFASKENDMYIENTKRI